MIFIVSVCGNLPRYITPMVTDLIAIKEFEGSRLESSRSPGSSDRSPYQGNNCRRSTSRSWTSHGLRGASIWPITRAHPKIPGRI